MKFFSKQHQYYCGIDLHARKMYVCIIDHLGILKMHQNIKTDPKTFLELVKPYMDDLSSVSNVSSAGKSSPIYAMRIRSLLFSDTRYT